MTRSRAILAACGSLLFALLVGPMLALIGDFSWASFSAMLGSPTAQDAIWLSIWTTTLTTLSLVLVATPVAWAAARTPNRKLTAVIRAVADFGVVLPPAVVGVALLLLFGRTGALAGLWAVAGWSPSFTTVAVLLAQGAVAAPLYLQSAISAFVAVDDDLLDVARTLGATPMTAVTRVAIPIAMPGLLAGAAMAWARALGEFGATLLFAGNIPQVTQTLPLAIYEALEANRGAATALSITLVAIAVVLLAGLRWLATRRGTQ